jgi:hypothetical protein
MIINQKSVNYWWIKINYLLSFSNNIYNRKITDSGRVMDDLTVKLTDYTLSHDGLHKEILNGSPPIEFMTSEWIEDWWFSRALDRVTYNGLFDVPSNLISHLENNRTTDWFSWFIGNCSYLSICKDLNVYVLVESFQPGNVHQWVQFYNRCCNSMNSWLGSISHTHSAFYTIPILFVLFLCAFNLINMILCKSPI